MSAYDLMSAYVVCFRLFIAWQQIGALGVKN